MLRGSEPSCCLAEKRTDVLSGGLFRKDSECERHSRKDVENERDLEVKETEESQDAGQIGHPYVSGVASLDGAVAGGFGRGRC